MLREMSARQVDEWLAFYQIEPWGLAVADFLFAHLKAVIANLFLKKGQRQIKPEKFLVWPDKPAARAVEEDEWQQLP